jgi:DUF1680 family protein
MFGNEEDAFWCCQGTGIENHNKYGEAIYFKNDSNLFVNLFIPSVLNWKAKNITLQQNTGFPNENTSIMRFKGNASWFTLQIRIPAWTKGALNVWVNNLKVKNENVLPGYFAITKNWSNNDEVKIELPMNIWSEALPDDSSKNAILYGPVVLAAAIGNENMPEIYTNNTYYNPPPDSLLSHTNMPEIEFTWNQLENMQRIDGTRLYFHLKTASGAYNLKPLFEIYNEKYQVLLAEN